MLISADFETIQNTIASLYFFKNPKKKLSSANPRANWETNRILVKDSVKWIPKVYGVQKAETHVLIFEFFPFFSFFSSRNTREL